MSTQGTGGVTLHSTAHRYLISVKFWIGCFTDLSRARDTERKLWASPELHGWGALLDLEVEMIKACLRRVLYNKGCRNVEVVRIIADTREDCTLAVMLAGPASTETYLAALSEGCLAEKNASIVWMGQAPAPLVRKPPPGASVYFEQCWMTFEGVSSVAGLPGQ